MPRRPSPYDVERKLAAELDRISDAQERAIFAAWLLAWSEISGDLFDTLSDLMSDGVKITAGAVARTDRLARMLAVVADRLVDLASEIGVTLTSDLDDVVGRGADSATLLIAAQLDDLDERRPTSRALDAIVRRTTQQLTSQLLPLADETYATIQAELTRGVALGESPQETARRMVDRAENHWNFGRSRAVTIARTEVMDAYREASEEGEQQYVDVLAGWAWLCHLGPGTCRSCLSMHGRLFGLEVKGPKDHQRGRCARCPVVRQADGTVDTSWIPSAAEHFAGLASEQQKKILGRRGYQAWAAGNFPIEAWTKTRSTEDWRDSQIPASPGDAGAGSGGGQLPPSTGGSGPDDPDPKSVREVLDVMDDDLDTPVEALADLIDQVHLVPGDMESIEVNYISDTLQAKWGPGLLGQYFHLPGMEPQLQGQRPVVLGVEFALVHEFGHAVDDLIFGDKKSNLTSASKTDLGGELAEWWAAVEGSTAYGWLAMMQGWDPTVDGPWGLYRTPGGGVLEWSPDPDFTGYLLRPSELFARAYCQWIIRGTGDTRLLSMLLKDLGHTPAGFRMLTPRIGAYPTQWEDDDFEAIAEAFRRLFEARGLLRGAE